MINFCIWMLITMLAMYCTVLYCIHGKTCELTDILLNILDIFENIHSKIKILLKSPIITAKCRKAWYSSPSYRCNSPLFGHDKCLSVGKKSVAVIWSKVNVLNPVFSNFPCKKLNSIWSNSTQSDQTWGESERLQPFS